MMFLDNQAVRLEGTGVYLVGIEDLHEGQRTCAGGCKAFRATRPQFCYHITPTLLK